MGWVKRRKTLYSLSTGGRHDAIWVLKTTEFDFAALLFPSLLHYNTCTMAMTMAMASSSAESKSHSLWELPEVILYHVVGYAAKERHASAEVLCHKIAPLCKAAHRVMFQEERSVTLWDAVLAGDYGVDTYLADKNKGTRSSKRLRRSPCHKVRDAHQRLKDNTELAFFYLSEMTHASGKNSLSKQKMCGILEEYGPRLRLDHRVSSGGSFLVEVCRARHVKESVILKCVEELVEARGANVNVATFEAQNKFLTALCVSAVRGMPKVVRYLLQHGASIEELNSGRFRLDTNPRKSVRCINVTALAFAQSMCQAELENGANPGSLTDLDGCIRMF